MGNRNKFMIVLVVIIITGGSIKNPTTLHNKLKMIVKRIDNHINFIYKYVSYHILSKIDRGNFF